MNISGIRPKQEFYAGMEKQEPEKKEMHRLNQDGYPYQRDRDDFGS